MATISAEYPRPDFRRNDFTWTLLNGEWDFLFDDEDVGLIDRWYRTGLPNEVVPLMKQDDNDQSFAKKLTQRITGFDSLIGSNEFKRASRPNTKCKIIVPFVFQTPASGIHDSNAHEVLWYERIIQDVRSTAEKGNGYHLLLRFGAVDYEATIWVDGHYVGSHEGGHVPFDLDVTDFIGTETARLTIRVRDSTYDLTQPRGKQYWAAQPESIFYTPSSGIWQNVWLESVPATRIADSSLGTVLRSDDVISGDLHATVAILGRRSCQQYSVEIEASLCGITINKTNKIELPREKNSVTLDVNLRLNKGQYDTLARETQGRLKWNNAICFKDGTALWSPSFPTLYDVTVRLYNAKGALQDSIITYTGMRSLTWNIGDNTFLLNGRPLFQKLCLDQGYWPETGITPPKVNSCKEDILLAQSAGFNGCRKHQKLEDPQFLYFADQLGYLVWSEMASGYEFHANYCSRFSKEWEAAVKRDINHPCIVTWTPANESWAYTNLKEDIDHRNHLRSLYYQTKILDPTRPINDNCGWEHVCTDLTTFHDYADAPQLRETCSSLEGILNDKAGHSMFCPPIDGKDSGSNHKDGAPVICTEFGGVNIKPSSDGDGKEWGYTTASNSEDLLVRIEALVRAVIGEGTKAQGLISGFVWTQLTDIEQEANGLFTFDRKPKIQVEKVRAIFEIAEKIYFEGLERRINDNNRDI